MTDAEILDLVRATLHDDWYGDGGSRRLKADHQMRVAPCPSPADGGWPPFHAPWIGRLGSHARLVTLELRYRERLIHRFDLVSVEGIDGYLPRPEPGTRSVRPDDYRLARALTPGPMLARALAVAGLAVAGEAMPYFPA